MRVMIVTENPCTHTGMAKVGGEIALYLHNQGHEIVYLCCGSGAVDEKAWPFKLIPVSGHSWGRDIFDDIIYAERPTAVLTIGDPWFYNYIADGNSCRSRRLFQWIGYIAIDGEKQGGGLPNFWTPIISRMDQIVAYTNFGKDALLKSYPSLKDKITVIYHGVDDKVFFPISGAARKKLRMKYALKDKFVFLVVARNQGRKNWPELFKAWKIVQEENLCPGAMLWPHTYFYDRAGHNIDDMLATLDLDRTNSVMFFSQIARGNSFLKLIPTKELNALYGLADALVSVGGEGFGLPVIEAMATKTPCMVLNHSATSELGAEGRSLLIEPSHYLMGKYLTERPVPSPREIADTMQMMYQKKEKREAMAKKAYSFALDNTWNRVGEKWLKLFDKLERPTKYPMILEEAT